MSDYTNQQLRSMEVLLIEKLKRVALWGDIELSKHNYEELSRLLSVFIQENPAWSVTLCEKFPVCVTTFAVFLIRYEFNYNFWSLLAEKLSVLNTIQFESTVGSCILNTFTRFGFDYSEASGGRKYLDPIIYEAGLPPESNLGDLFYVLKYDSHSVFDPIGVIEDLIESRSYAIRKPMLRFLKHFREDRAIDFVIEANDAIRCLDYNMSGESKYTDSYRAWKSCEQNKTGAAARRKQEFQTRPYLMFEDGKKGLCMVLPRTVLNDEWMDEVFWSITTDATVNITKQMLVSGMEGIRTIHQIVVPVPPAHSYDVRLIAQDGVSDSILSDYSINGIPSDGAVFFNSVGRMINPVYLPSPFCVMVAADSVATSGEGVHVMRQCYPTDANGFSCFTVEQTGSNAVFRFDVDGKRRELRARPQVRLLLTGPTLFDLPVKDGIFTAPPTLTVIADDGVCLDDLSVRINNDGNMIQLTDFLAEHTAEVPLPSGSIRECGSYSVRLYENDHFLKQIEFSLVPRIRSDLPTEITWQDGLIRKGKQVFHFQKTSGWALEFEDCSVSHTETEYVVSCPAALSAISGSLQNTNRDNGFSCRFTVPLRPVSAEILTPGEEKPESLTDKPAKLDVAAIAENEHPLWLRLQAYGVFGNKSYSISLRTQNGIEQTVPIPVLRGGGANLNLSVFSDTLRVCSLPAVLELTCADEPGTLPLIGLRKTARFSVNPVYQPGKTAFLITSANDGKHDFILKRFGAEDAFRFYAEDARLGNGGRKLGYPGRTPLPDGFYLLDADMEDNCFLDDTDTEFSLSKDTPVVDVRNIAEDNEKNGFAHWFDLFLKDVLHVLPLIRPEQRQTLKSVAAFRAVSRADHHDPLTRRETEGLVILTAVFLNEKVMWKKEWIRCYLRLVSKNYLSGTDRTQIIRTILRTNCSTDILDACTVLFDLFLFAPPEDAQTLADQLDGKAEGLALLMRLRNNEPMQKTILRGKFRDLIGKEALRRMLHVPDTDDPAEIAAEQKKFFRGDPTTRTGVYLDSDIAGEMKPIQAMIVTDTKNPHLDMSKKPDTGTYFWQIRYVDQYLNWFKKNYDHSANLNEKTKMEMLQAQQECVPAIVSCMNEIKKKYRAAADYDAVLKKRYAEPPAQNLTRPIASRFFYILGAASLLWELQEEDPTLQNAITSIETFLCAAFGIAPRMTERDLMLAAVYTYLIRKEERL